MAKKFINGENLIYALDKFEQDITQKIENITNISMAEPEDIKKMFIDEVEQIEQIQEDK